MFRTVGSQPPAVYWRRRIAFVGTLLLLVVLIVVTARVLLGGDGAAAPPAGQGSTAALSSPHPSRTPATTAAATTTPPRSTSSSGTGSASGSTSVSTSTPAPKPCDRSALEVRAASDRSSYSVGDKPKLMLQVTNTAKVACTQDLADPQIDLRVYNGESRVWDSHDCKIISGTNEVTLEPSAPVRVTIIWSGLSSRANDAHTEDACGPRQVVGAGTYTLYAYLAGKPGQAAQFAIN